MSNLLQPPGGYTKYNALAALMAALTSKRYIHISFHFVAPMTELEGAHRVQSVVNTADDWLKYAGNCWIVWSRLTPKQWFEKFEAVPELSKCSVLIVRLDLSPENRSGQLPEWAWEWMRKART